VQSNLVGMGHVLEGCRHHGVEHLLYASSSSVYGGNHNLPFCERQPVNHPVSLYAATKKASELMTHTYSHLYGLPATGLRFFTVYGPWGRPDMAPMLFARAILAGEPIRVFNHGRMRRDFTYIDDIVEGVVRCLDKPASPEPAFERRAPDPQGLLEVCPSETCQAAAPTVRCAGPALDPWPLSPPPSLLLQAI
jgi:UDP-glucuronate 4-epimerase